MRRFDGNLIHHDWHPDRVVAAIRSAVQDPEKPAIADALAEAVAKQEARERVAAGKRNQAEMEAAHAREEEAMVSSLQADLRVLRSTDPGMTLLTPVEYITPHPAHRIALYRYCHAADQSIVAAKEIALLERRAKAEGFQI
jgi:hypothetical protein